MVRPSRPDTVRADFDDVDIHGADSEIIDQYTQAIYIERTDEYRATEIRTRSGSRSRCLGSSGRE